MELEGRADEIVVSDIPSGESLAAELSRFLKERDEQGGSGPAATDQ